MFNRLCYLNGSWAGLLTAVALLAPAQDARLYAQASDGGSSDVAGRVEFDFSGAPPATVEIDISQGMLADVSGISRAAVRGVVQALLESAPGDGHAAVRESAEHLSAVDEIVGALTSVVREVRVRLYEDLPGDGQDTVAPLVSHYRDKLQGTEWDSVVRVNDGDDVVNVSALRDGGAIRGLFISVADNNDLVLINIVCELTPERIEQVTHQATKIGMKFGLERAIEQAMREVQRELR